MTKLQSEPARKFPFKILKGIAVIGVMVLLAPLNTPVIKGEGPAVRGLAHDLWADLQVGKRDFAEIGPREVVPYKVSAPGGVIVDTSVSPGRMYGIQVIAEY